MHKLKIETDKEIKERRGEVQNQERRLIQKEENLDRRIETYDKREKEELIKDSNLLNKFLGNKIESINYKRIYI